LKGISKPDPPNSHHPIHPQRKMKIINVRKQIDPLVHLNLAPPDNLLPIYPNSLFLDSISSPNKYRVIIVEEGEEMEPEVPAKPLPLVFKNICSDLQTTETDPL
jgi:hypothetical protein